MESDRIVQPACKTEIFFFLAFSSEPCPASFVFHSHWYSLKPERRSQISNFIPPKADWVPAMAPPNRKPCASSSIFR